MNPNTGEIYRGEEALAKIAAGEAVAVSEQVAEAVTIGRQVQERRKHREEQAKHQTRPRTKAHFPRW